MRVGVVGHVEWVEFLAIDHVPRAGEIVRGNGGVAVAAGGGGVAAVAAARWGAESHFFTSLGNDALGKTTRDDLTARGVTVHACERDEPQRRGIVLIDAQRERTIIVVGERHIARRADPLPWNLLATCDAVYVTGGDRDAVRAARAAKVVVSTARILPLLRDAGIELDALVGSDDDAAERYTPGMLPHPPRLVVRTRGADGGTFSIDGAAPQHYPVAPAQLTGDTYGAGDTFAAGLPDALGEGKAPDAAIAFAASRAAEVLAFRGPYPPVS
jgi:ribokinase